MILMALTCMNDVTAKEAAEKYIVDELGVNYSSYNEYSKSLAVQVRYSFQMNYTPYHILNSQTV